MKILAINGSYRKKGNTARILEIIAAQMRSLASENRELLDFEIIHLGHLKIQPCRGCRMCFDHGENKCPLKDDLLTIREKMQVADSLVISTPVYVNDVSGIVKTWLDRLAFVCHRPEFTGKPAYLIATTGLGTSSHALKTLHMALSIWGFSIVGQASFKMSALMAKERVEAHFRTQTQKVAKKLFAALTYEKQITPSFISLMTFRIQQDFWSRNPRPGTVDYEYWQNQGWTHPQRDYYMTHSASRIKVNFARMVGAILAPFVT